MAKVLLHLFVIAFLTVISQLGGAAWAIALCFKSRKAVFLVAYTVLSLSALWIAPIFGRVPLSCQKDDPLHMQSWTYCALNRQYVVPELKLAASDLANAINTDFPGTVTLALDENFPFIAGFPLLPHLSHDDGRKLDIAFYYRDEGGYVAGTTRSPIGYFAFENGPSDCPEAWPTLRWNFAPFQKLWPDLEPEPERMVAALNRLAGDPRIQKIFIEPHLQDRFGVQSAKLRFQGCRAARHDDHIHLQL